VEDINKAITLHREAVELRQLPHRDRDVSLNNLATALQMRSDVRAPTPADVDEIIQVQREALGLRSPPHPDRGNSLTNLANTLYERFRQWGSRNDIDEAIGLHREAVDLYPPSRPGRESYLNNLANALQTRFDQQGNTEDITQAIQLFREAVILLPTSPAFLASLAAALHSRYGQRRNPVDMEESVQLLEQALPLVPAPHVDRSGFLTDLATALQERSQDRVTPEENERIIQLHTEALSLHPSSHPDHSRFLTNLATALCARFELRQEKEDIHKAIRLFREALSYLPATHPSRGIVLADLALALHARFEPKSDLDEVAKLFREGLDLHPPPHPERGRYLLNLARTLVAVWIEFKRDCLDEAMSVFRAASSYTASPFLFRFKCSKHWAYNAHYHGHSSALDGYQAAISLLPYLASLDLDLQSRQKLLLTEGSRGLAADAAACAVAAGKHDLAVGFLEGGRSVFWSQALHLRTPLDHIRKSLPELAEKLLSLAKELEHGSFRDAARNLSTENPERVVSMEAEGARLAQLQSEWTETVNLIRTSAPEFKHFMEPPQLKQLRSAAKYGPVVILTPAKDFSHALIVNSSGTIQSIHLPGLPQDFVELLAKIVQALSGQATKFNSFMDALHGRGERHQDRLVGKMVYEKSRSPNDYFKVLLSTLWHTIAEPVVEALSIRVGREMICLHLLVTRCFIDRCRPIRLVCGGVQLGPLRSSQSMQPDYTGRTIFTALLTMSSLHILRPSQPSSSPEKTKVHQRMWLKSLPSYSPLPQVTATFPTQRRNCRRSRRRFPSSG
jgi:tetratricopeptide (TPR) repeat protein